MGDFPRNQGSRQETIGAVNATSRGVTVTSSASVNTKGSWTALTGLTQVTSFGSNGFYLFVNSTGNQAQTDYLLDIGIDSDQVIISNLPYSSGTNWDILQGVYFPLLIPEGTELFARCQADAGSSGLFVHVISGAMTFPYPKAFSRSTTYGDDTSDSGGTSIDPGGTADTKGSWTEITSSTGEDIKALLIGVGTGANYVRTANGWLFDVGIGAASSEQVVIEEAAIHASTIIDRVGPQFIGPFYVSIPSGTRLAVRAQSVITDASDRLFDVILYGLS